MVRFVVVRVARSRAVCGVQVHAQRGARSPGLRPNSYCITALPAPPPKASAAACCAPHSTTLGKGQEGGGLVRPRTFRREATHTPRLVDVSWPFGEHMGRHRPKCERGARPGVGIQGGERWLEVQARRSAQLARVRLARTVQEAACVSARAHRSLVFQKFHAVTTFSAAF